MKHHILSRDGILRTLQSLMAAELTSLRQESAQSIALLPWHEQVSIGPAAIDAPSADSLEADSFELIALATRVATFFQLYQSGIEDYLLSEKALGAWADLISASRRKGHTDITLRTSGTTGEPKACQHHWADLEKEAEFFHSQFAPLLGGKIRRIIALAPCHHIYSFLFSVVMPDKFGIEVIAGNKALSHTQGRQLLAGDLVVGFPFIWQQLCRQGLTFPSGVMGLCSTAPAGPGLAGSLQGLGLSHWVEIYGSTETGGIGFRTSAEAPFELLPRWQAEGDRLRDIRQQRLFDLADNLQWPGERQLLPLGRKDGAVQVGGINVYPQVIARQLAELPEVAAAQVEKIPGGERLRANIIPLSPQTDTHALTALLQQWCARHLSAPERPVTFTLKAAAPDVVTANYQ